MPLLPKIQNPKSKIPYLFLVGWALVMIAVPIGLWTVGERSTPVLMLTAVTLQATAVLLFLAQSWGWGRALATAVLIALLGWGVEAFGSRTGLLFGAYHYTDRLQPQILGVPLLVPLAWFMMLPICWGVATMLLTGKPFNVGRLVLWSAVAMTAWDLFLDPQMVLWQFWVWDNVPTFSYFGIPWHNYAGWLLSAAVMTAATHALVRPPWSQIPAQPFLLIYAITWFLETFGLLLFWGLPGPALVGGLVMGGLLVQARRTPR